MLPQITPTTGRPSKLEGADLRGLREFGYGKTEFAQACALFERFTGMTMIKRKRDLVYGRLIRRLRATGETSFETYLARVERDKGEAEHFVNSLTTNLTSFFREAHHFPILAEHATRKRSGRRYRVWCAAASTGEEPYSIAMTLAQAHGLLPSPAEVIATDIDTNVLSSAREGTYSEERVASLDGSALRDFFLRGKGKHVGKVRVIEALRKSIVFRQQNLLGGRWSVNGPFDAIFLRNVMIYFDRDSQVKTLEKIHSHLADDGLLFTGHAESLFYASHLFKAVNANVYRKR